MKIEGTPLHILLNMPSLCIYIIYVCKMCNIIGECFSTQN